MVAATAVVTVAVMADVTVVAAMADVATADATATKL